MSHVKKLSLSLNMKRQAGITRELDEESRQNNVNENKRLKLLDDSQEDYVNEQAPAGTSSHESSLQNGAQPSISDNGVTRNTNPMISTPIIPGSNSAGTSFRGASPIECIFTNGQQDSQESNNSSHNNSSSSYLDEVPLAELVGMETEDDNYEIPELKPENVFKSDEEVNDASKSDEEISSHSDTDIESNDPLQQPPVIEKEVPQPSVSNNGRFSPSLKGECSSRSTNSEAKSPVLVSMKVNLDIENITSSLLQVTQLEGHADCVLAVAASKDIVLSSSADTTIKVWNVDTKEEICSFRGHNGAVTSVVLLSEEQSKSLACKISSSAPRIALSASLDCHIRIWSVFDGEELMSMYTFNGINCMGYLEDPSYVVIGTEGGKLDLWEISTAKLVHSVKNAHEDSISDLQVKNLNVYSASIDGTVKVWLVDDDELQPKYTRRRKEIAPNKRDLIPAHWNSVAMQGGMLFLSDNTCNLKILDFETARLTLLRNQAGEIGASKAIFAKKDILLSSFYDSSSNKGGINVWQLPAATYVCTIMGDVQEICTLAMTETNDKKLRIVSGGSKLLVCDFDFTKPPKSGGDFHICEMEQMGTEMDNQSPKQSTQTVLTDGPSSTQGTGKGDGTQKKSWCNFM